MIEQKTYALPACLIVLALCACIARVNAAGTPAGTVITSQARAEYRSGGGAVGTVVSNTVTMTVRQVAVVNMTPATSAKTSAGDSVNVDYALKAMNSGNGNDLLNLTSASTRSFACTFYHDANGNGTLEPAELSAGAITQTPTLSADTEYDLIARIFVPKDPSLNGQQDVTSVIAASNFDPAKTAAFIGTTTVSTAVFDLSNSLSVVPSTVPAGSTVTYTFTAFNSGTIPATDVTITDPIVSPLSYESATSTGFIPPGAGTNAVWSIGTIAPGASATVTITLRVAANAPNAQVLTNPIGLTYSTPGGVRHAQTSNDPFAVVGPSSGVSVVPRTTAVSVEMEDTVSVPVAVKNLGNTKDVFEVTAASAIGLTWQLFADRNGNGVIDGGDTPLTNTNANAGIDVDSLGAGETIALIARTIIPTGITADELLDNSIFTVTASANASVTHAAALAVTINIPIIELNRSVAPSVTRLPGETNTYTTTYKNVGHGKAYNVRIVETEPDSCSYIANSTVVGGVRKTDASDGDEVTVSTAGGRKVITVSLGMIPAQAPSVPVAIKFDAVIK